MNIRTSIILAAIGLLLFVSAACRHETWHPVTTIIDTTGGNGIDTTINYLGSDTSTDTTFYIPQQPCSGDSVYFVNDIYPIISSNCTDSVHGCHYSGYRKDGGPLMTYTQIRKLVNKSTPTKTELYKVIASGGGSDHDDDDDDDRMPRKPFTALSQEQIALILKWIEQGAKNNYCDGNVDTSNVTYNRVIAPMVKANCITCHGSPTLSGKESMMNYQEVKSLAKSGKLQGAVHRQSGFSAMPPAPTLTKWDLVIIDNWIRHGAPE